MPHEHQGLLFEIYEHAKHHWIEQVGCDSLVKNHYSYAYSDSLSNSQAKSSHLVAFDSIRFWRQQQILQIGITQTNKEGQQHVIWQKYRNLIDVTVWWTFGEPLWIRGFWGFRVPTESFFEDIQKVANATFGMLIPCLTLKKTFIYRFRSFSDELISLSPDLETRISKDPSTHVGFTSKMHNNEDKQTDFPDFHQLSFPTPIP